MDVDRLKKTSIAISAVLLAVSIFMWAQLSGFEYGFFYGVFQNPPSRGFAEHGAPNYYQSLNGWYLSICVCLSFVLITKFFRYRVASGVISILLLAFITISAWNMIDYKTYILPSSHSYLWSDRDWWLTSSIYIDWFCIFAFVVLLVIEIWMVRLAKVRSES